MTPTSPLLSMQAPRLPWPGVAAAATAVAACATIAYTAAERAPANTLTEEAIPQLSPAEPPPLIFRDVAPKDAVSINRNIPFADRPTTPAKSFHISTKLPAYSRALECLTSAIYYEAARETVEGQRAVAQVVLNRVRHPAFASAVCGVVYEGSTRETGCQFSFTCDGSLRRTPSRAGWNRSREVAKAALAGSVFAPAGLSTHYHANYVVPYWATSLDKTAVEGTHIFYRWRGWWGQRAAFSRRYKNLEHDPSKLRLAALQAEDGLQLSARAPAERVLYEFDSRIELLAVIHHLAFNEGGGIADGGYSGAVRSHFGSHHQNVAVQLYRQLAAGNDPLSISEFAELIMHYSPAPALQLRKPPPARLLANAGGKEKLFGFIAALRDFADHTDFAAFHQRRQSQHAQLVARAETSYSSPEAASKDQPGSERRVILAPLLKGLVSTGCEVTAGQTQSWVVLGTKQATGTDYKKAALAPTGCRAMDA